MKFKSYDISLQSQYIPWLQCPGVLRCQGINSHNVDHVGHADSQLPPTHIYEVIESKYEYISIYTKTIWRNPTYFSYPTIPYHDDTRCLKGMESHVMGGFFP